MKNDLQVRDLRLQLMTGIDIPVPELALTIHQPTCKDIAYIGEEQFFSSIQYLCLEKDQLVQDKKILQKLTNFQVLMKVLQQSKNYEKKIAVDTVLRLLLSNYQVAFLGEQSIILSQEGSEQPILLDDNNFAIFQEIVKQILCVTNIFQGDNIVYNPQSDAAKRIVEKIMRGRQRVAQQRNANGGSSVLTRYLSILAVGLGYNINELLDLTLFQVFDLMERYSAKIEWDIDLKVRLAGGKPDQQIESWMRELHTKV